jgi:hypothetical protein
MRSIEWKADPLFVLRTEFENITANVLLHGFNPSTSIRLENLSQRLEEQALWREGDKTGHIRFERRTPKPNGVKLTLRFDEPTQLSDAKSKEVGTLLDGTLRQLETLLTKTNA